MTDTQIIHGDMTDSKELDVLMHTLNGEDRKIITNEDVYNLLVDVHAQQAQMMQQLNGFAELINSATQQIPAFVDTLTASPIGGILARFLPKG